VRYGVGAIVALAAVLAGAAPRSTAAAGPDDVRLLTPKAFQSAVETVLPSVVRIETYGGVFDPAKAGSARRGPSGGAGGRRPRRIRAIGQPGEGPTTGLVVSPDGLILTSTFEFLKSPPIITVALADGSRHVARLRGRDETRQLCLLKVEGVSDLPVPATVPRDRLRVGQWAISVGVGYGAEAPALSVGIVSAVHRIFGRAVQTDANLSPANYGGPLVDIDGRVIGLCVPLSPHRGGPAGGVPWYDSGIGFAVPLAGLEPIIRQMARGETIRAARLGVRPAGGGREGVRIEAVVEGSAAAKAGLKKGDVIVAVDGEAVRDVMHLRLLVGRHVAGEVVALAIRRDGETTEAQVTLGAGEDSLPEPRPFDLGGQGGPRGRDGAP